MPHYLVIKSKTSSRKPFVSLSHCVLLSLTSPLALTRSSAVSAVIKWGSLVLGDATSIPFTPNNALAITAVVLPPAAYAVRFLMDSSSSNKEE